MAKPWEPRKVLRGSQHKNPANLQVESVDKKSLSYIGVRRSGNLDIGYSYKKRTKSINVYDFPGRLLYRT